jgi:hypothetical protein
VGWWAALERQVVALHVDPHAHPGGSGGGWRHIHEIVVEVDLVSACTEDGTTDAVCEGLDQPERR